MLLAVYVFVGWVFCSFAFSFLSSLLAKGSGDWRVLRSSRVSPLWFGGLGSLDPAWPLIKLKSLPKDVDQNMEPWGGVLFF